jgi:hypothetical protein
VSAAALVAVGAGVGVGVYLDRQKRTLPALPVRSLPRARMQVRLKNREQSQSGLVIDDHGMRVKSWDKWIPFARKSMRQAIALGHYQAEPILIYMLQSAFPDRPWPPPPHSLVGVDYRGMLAVLSSQIDPDPMPETRPHLRVVS